MTPTGIVFITKESAYMQPTIVIPVSMLGINKVKPCALFANPFDAVPNTVSYTHLTLPTNREV